MVVELEDEELDLYLDLSKKIARLLPIAGAVERDEPSPTLEALLNARARLIGGARGKLSALAEAIGPFGAEPYSLVYCSDSTVNGSDERQIRAVAALLGRQLGMRVAEYTQDTSMRDRRERIELFEHGELDALIAIRCLDEGVDIPATRRAFILASSTNPRQYVQRRGRILRPYVGKQVAEVFDFLVVPPVGSLSEDLMRVERSLVRREMERVVEFARDAQNGPAALAELLPLQQRYDLLHLG